MQSLSNSKKIGWIGTGVMGLSMCRHLINSGFKLYVYNRTISKVDPLVQLGAISSDPISIAKEVDYLFMIVGFPVDVETLTLGENGIIRNMKKGSYLIDHTTSSPQLAKKIYDEAAKYDVFSFDVPVTGGDVGAKEGKLVSFVGGDKDQFENIKPIIDVYSKSVTYLGTAGFGQHAKMVNQIAICGNIQGTCESLLYAYKSGLDVQKVMELIGQGAAGSTQINVYGPRILKRDFEAGFFADHFLKDIEIAIEESKRMGLDLKCLKLAQELYTYMIKDGLGKKGHHGLLLALEKLNNVEVEITKK